MSKLDKLAAKLDEAIYQNDLRQFMAQIKTLWPHLQGWFGDIQVKVRADDAGVATVFIQRGGCGLFLRVIDDALCADPDIAHPNDTKAIGRMVNDLIRLWQAAEDPTIHFIADSRAG